MDIELFRKAAAEMPPEVMPIIGFFISSGIGGWLLKWYKEDIEFKQKTELDIAQIAEFIEMPRGLDLAPKLREKYKNKKWFKTKGE